MLHLRAFGHANVTVTDLDRARAFYGGVLGLKEIPRPGFETSGAWYQIGDVEIHLTVRDLSQPEGRRRARGRPHLAFLVDDPEEVERKLAQAGLLLAGDVQDGAGGYRQLFIEDPDGNVIELYGQDKSASSPKA